jgi:hypothetical protein
VERTAEKFAEAGKATKQAQGDYTAQPQTEPFHFSLLLLQKRDLPMVAYTHSQRSLSSQVEFVKKT